jgi:hypothetical protein
MVAEQENGRFAMIKSLLETRQRQIDKVIDRLPVADLDDRVLGRRVPAWREIVDHAAQDDPHWGPADHSARVAAVTAQVLQVGGWYDIFLPQQLSDYRTLVAAGNPPRLVIGPWTHTSPQGFSVQVTESLRWLDRHCRHSGEAARATAPEVRLFVMGADEWRDAASWPPPGYRSQRWHLHPGGGLAPADPPGGEPDRYTYDPADPTPNVGGTLLRRSGGRRNQVHTERRPDVIVFTSDVLVSDLDVVGEISAEIHVSSDLEHFDVFVRLCDVDDKGRSYNVCDGMERVSPTRHPRPETGIWQVRVALWPTAQRFRSGHRIRVQVSSGAHPRFIRHLGTGDPVATATVMVMAVAHQAIHHDPLHPSAIILSVPGKVDTSGRLRQDEITHP